jgi:hypothetical protein
MPFEVSWLGALEPRAPDVVAAFRRLEEGRAIALRQELRQRAGPGSASAVVRQLDAVTDSIVEITLALPEAAFGHPGGEEGWTVAEALGHVVDARIGLTLAGALGARDRWPADARPVVPGVPGPADATREQLLGRLARSRRSIAHAGLAMAGHEMDPCPLDHPLVGRLRCGGWLLFAGVHDCMHLDQLHALAASLGAKMASKTLAGT